MNRPVVYVGGPMTAKASHAWARNCFGGLEPTVRLLRAGAAVHCPLLQGLFMERDFRYDDIIDLDLSILVRCDFLYLCPGWSHSRGALREREVAIEHRIPVYWGKGGLVDLIKRLKEWQ